ncbi:conserved hypothetical protein, partial [Ricinus communis]
ALRRVGEAEGYVAELHFALDVLDFGKAGRFFAVADRIFQRVEVHELGASLENLVGEVAQLFQTADQHVGESDEGDESAEAQAAILYEDGADHQDRHHGDGRGRAVQCAGKRPPVEDRILGGKQTFGERLQRLGFSLDAVVAVQHRYVADRVADMRENRVVVAFDRGLAILRTAHDQTADDPVEDAEQDEDCGQAQVHGHGGWNHDDERDGGRQMVAHEFKPQAEQRFAGAQQRVQRARRAALAMPGERHRDDAAECFGEQGGAAAMRKAISLAGHHDEGDSTEDGKASPQYHRGRDSLFLGNGVEDAAEQNRFVDGGHRKRDVCDHDHPNAVSIRAKILQGSCIDFEQ